MLVLYNIVLYKFADTFHIHSALLMEGVLNLASDGWTHDGWFTTAVRT